VRDVDRLEHLDEAAGAEFGDREITNH
jgi:hypothetical protein